MQFIHAVIAFEAVHGLAQMAYVASVLPSLIVALTNYPKTAGVLTTVLKTLNLFSILVHKDSPGTMKAPFVQSAPPAVVGIPVLK